MNKKVIVLLSGGVDSTTCLAAAIDKYGACEVVALSMYYGQKHDREIKAAQAVADYYGVTLMKRDLSLVFSFSDCTLLSGRNAVAHGSYIEQQKQSTNGGVVDTYVPFRNGLFLSYAAAIAYSIGAEAVYYGAHADDAAGGAYPDCTPQFASSIGEAIREGTGQHVRLVAPLIDLNKTGVVKMGLALHAPYHLTWSCYEGGDRPCGKCGTCIDRAKAFEGAGMVDPALVLQQCKDVEEGENN